MHVVFALRGRIPARLALFATRSVPRQWMTPAMTPVGLPPSAGYTRWTLTGSGRNCGGGRGNLRMAERRRRDRALPFLFVVDHSGGIPCLAGGGGKRSAPPGV